MSDERLETADQLADILSVTETPDDARRIADNARALAARPAYRAPCRVVDCPENAHRSGLCRERHLPTDMGEVNEH